MTNWLEPDGPLPRVSIVIPTHNRLDALRATLEHLERVDYPVDLFEIVVVDDGGDDDPTTVVAGAAAPVHLIRQPSQGAAAARNRGAREATGTLLVFLDDDMLVEPDHLRHHVQVQRDHGPLFVTGTWRFVESIQAELESTPFGRFRLGIERWLVDAVPMEQLDETCFEMPGTTAANLGVPAAVFAELGGFDETFPHAGYEDQELSARAARAGHRFVYCHAIRLAHNDRRLTVDEFGERLRRGALTAVHMAAKDPSWVRDRPFVVENLHARRGDGVVASAKKATKSLLSRPRATRALYRLIVATERGWPSSPALPRLYRLMSGLALFRGVREGLAALPEAESKIRAALVTTS